MLDLLPPCICCASLGAKMDLPQQSTTKRRTMGELDEDHPRTHKYKLASSQHSHVVSIEIVYN